MDALQDDIDGMDAFPDDLMPSFVVLTFRISTVVNNDTWM